MADFVDSTVREIESRIEELKEELTRLEAARSALVGIRRGPGRPKGSTSSGSAGSSPSHGGRRRGPGRPRGPRGSNTRSNQALSLVRERPGIKIPEMAEEMKIEPNYLYRVMPKLVADGLVKRVDQGWHPTDSDGSPSDENTDA